MTYQQGDVVWHPDPFNPGSHRPFVVVNNARHPFHGEEYLCATVTTTERPPAITLVPEDYLDGGLDRDSYVSPWSLYTLKHATIDRRVGRLATSVIEDVATAIDRYVSPIE